MLYYKVTMQTDMKQHTPVYAVIGEWIENELYTEKELERKSEKIFIPYYILEEIEIPKSAIFWAFGCRFQSREYAEKSNLKKRIYNTAGKLYYEYEYYSTVDFEIFLEAVENTVQDGIDISDIDAIHKHITENYI